MNRETFVFEYRVKASTSKWKHFAKFSSQNQHSTLKMCHMQRDFLIILEETEEEFRVLIPIGERQTQSTFKHTERAGLRRLHVRYKVDVLRRTPG